MSHSKFSQISWRAGLYLTIVMMGACNLPEPPQSSNTMPSEYVTKHMPEGWWTDQAIRKEGRQLYLGTIKPNVNCAKCHGQDWQTYPKWQCA